MLNISLRTEIARKLSIRLKLLQLNPVFSKNLFLKQSLYWPSRKSVYLSTYLFERYCNVSSKHGLLDQSQICNSKQQCYPLKQAVSGIVL